MNLIHPASLAQTLDALNDAFFFARPIPSQTRQAAAAFIVSRHRQDRAYANTFALFPDELAAGIRLFTGERVRCAGAAHIAGQEACRILRLLNPCQPAARTALDHATTSLQQRVGPPSPRNPRPDDGKLHWEWPYRGGVYCCGKCSVGFWRNILAGSFDDPQTRLARGLKCLRDFRNSDHQWHRFPFWYTILAVVEMPPLKPALDEMRHAAPRCQSFAGRKSDNPFANRRRELARRLLARV